MDNYTLSDVAAVTRPNFMGGGYGMGGFGGDWLAILVLFALFGGWGGGFGGGFGGGNGIGLQNGFDTQSILRGQEGIKNGLCDGFYRTAVDNLQAQNQLQRDLCQGFSTTSAAIAENRFAAQQCCCETQRLIEGVKYANQQNTCDIVNAIHAEGTATRDLITQNKIEALMAENSELKSANQFKDVQLSQIKQNEYLVKELNPKAVPAFVVQNPNCCTSACGACNGYNQFA